MTVISRVPPPAGFIIGKEFVYWSTLHWAGPPTLKILVIAWQRKDRENERILAMRAGVPPENYIRE
jgi:hypothetical protein